MIGFSFAMSASCVHVLPSCSITSCSFSLMLFTDLADGLMISFPLYFRKFHPSMSKPSSICVTSVFSSDSISPLDSRNARITSFARSAVSRLAAVIIKSSAYRTRLTLLANRSSCVLWNSLSKTASIPSSVMFAKIGEMMPPCGVPSSVGKSCLE